MSNTFVIVFVHLC